jgi:hypothetical protein
MQTAAAIALVDGFTNMMNFHSPGDDPRGAGNDAKNASGSFAILKPGRIPGAKNGEKASRAW